MSVEIRKEYPPNIDEIRAKFPLTGREIFAWDGVIYNPGGGEITPWLEAHEAVHFEQQAAVGGPENWWRRYIDSAEFRYEQELEAHRMEYQVFSLGKSRPMRRAFLKMLAKRLSSPMYGGVASYEKARKEIMA